MTARLSVALVLAVMTAPLSIAQVPAQRAPITLQGSGPFHRLTLPAAIHSLAAFGDLRDVRVLNAAAVAVPFAWLGDESDAPAVSSHAAALFALPSRAGGTQPASDGPLGVRLRADGSLALTPLPPPQRNAAAAAAATTTAADWLIDARQANGAMLQLRFTLAADARGVFPFRLDGSDDLRQWRPVADDEQLVRLQQDGRTIERMAVELDHLRARFLRLHWRDAATAPPLSGVTIDSVQAGAPAAAIEWTAPLPPSACGVDFCDYRAPRGLPLQSVRVELAQPNTLAAVQLSSVSALPQPARRPRNALYVLRHGRGASTDSTSPEQLLADTVVYRLQQPGGEAHSAAVALDGGAHTVLRLRTRGPIGALGNPAPTLSFGSRPRVLMFLAQGPAPFTLSWGTAGQTPLESTAGALTLAQLMPGQPNATAVRADLATVSLPSVPPEAPMASSALTATATSDSRKLWLWAALGAGLLLLAAMAWSLLRSIKTRP